MDLQVLELHEYESIKQLRKVVHHEKNQREQHLKEPPCTIIELNKPNFERMAKAFLQFYKQTRKRGSI
ncbi:hypothetical protein LQ50_18560 [Halalkalibacter okhensis]|uniref:Uncharacterized protein n=1 Tax=Halalkalibacter okhensis TaxID=333138 RepID=A0A0B0IFW0_9BACI|nr:hypothetical protein LQ50_18560 [Halalkalibacter okhensis]